MIRLVFRTLALFFLAVAVILAVVDATRSVAVAEFITTPLGQSWFAVSPSSLNLTQAVIQRYTFPVIWDPVMVWILTWPGFAVFAVLALLFYAIGHRSGRAGTRIAA